MLALKESRAVTPEKKVGGAVQECYQLARKFQVCMYRR